MIKRVTVIMAMLVLAVPLIFAAGGQEKGEEVPVVIDTGDTMTSSLVNGHGHDGFYEEYIFPKFREKYPDVEIKDPPTTLAGRGMESVEKFLIAVATNDVPDLISGGEENPPAYGDRGILLDLRPYMEQDLGFWFSDEHYSQALLESDGSPNGGIYVSSQKSRVRT